MKKKIKMKYIAVILILAMLISNTVYAAGNESGKASGAELLKNKIDAIEEEQEKFLASEDVVRNNEANKIYQMLEKNICDEEYSSFYGGSYINDNNELVILVTNLSEENLKKIKEVAGNDDIVIERGAVTVEYLKELQESYNEKMKRLMSQDNLTEDEQELVDSFVGISLIQRTSELVIKIHEINNEKIETFKRTLGCDENVRFENADRISATASWYVGKKIRSSAGHEFSTGYRAYYINGAGVRKNGFVTAGHGCSVGNTIYGVINSGSVVLGTCLLSMATGSVDAAFVEITNNNYSMSNTVDSAIASSTTVLATTVATGSDYAEGTYIYSFGMKTNMVAGRVRSTSFSGILINPATYENQYCVDMIEASNKVLGGDSGGCVCITKSGGYATVGTVAGREGPILGDSSDTTAAYFSKIENQISTLGVAKY